MKPAPLSLQNLSLTPEMQVINVQIQKCWFHFNTCVFMYFGFIFLYLLIIFFIQFFFQDMEDSVCLLRDPVK